jgi:hypothetical protein
MGMVDKAIEALGRAVDLGYADLYRLRRDPDLKSLRSDPRYYRIIRKL